MTLSNQNKRRILFTIILFLFTVIFWMMLHYRSLRQEVGAPFQKVYLVLRIVQKYYVEDVEVKAIMDAGINGMLTTLDAPGYYCQAESSHTGVCGLFPDSSGPGLHLITLKKFPVVLATYPFSSAAKAEIRPGEILYEIDSVVTYRMPIEMVYQKLHGEPGTKVQLGIKNPNSGVTRQVNLVRARLSPEPILTSYLIDQRTGYLKLGHFGPGVSAKLNAQLEAFTEQGMQRLLLDLRGNSSGLLDEAIQVISLFTKKEQLLLRIKGRQKRYQQEFVNKQAGAFEAIPLIIIIDNGTAQWAEAVAGVLQDLDRAVIVGENSFGLADIRTTHQLSDGSQISLVVAQFYTPGKRCPGRTLGQLSPADLAAELDSVVAESIRTERGHFNTINGRSIYAHEGITPDKMLRSVKPTGFIYQIIEKELIQQFVVQAVVNDSPFPFTRKSLFKLNFARHPLFLNFKRFVRQKKISFTEQEWQGAQFGLQKKLKTEIAEVLFGQEQAFIIDSQNDRVVQLAVKQFDSLIEKGPLSSKLVEQLNRCEENKQLK